MKYKQYKHRDREDVILCYDGSDMIQIYYNYRFMLPLGWHPLRDNLPKWKAHFRNDPQSFKFLKNLSEEELFLKFFINEK